MQPTTTLGLRFFPKASPDFRFLPCVPPGIQSCFFYSSVRPFVSATQQRVKKMARKEKNAYMKKKPCRVRLSNTSGVVVLVIVKRMYKIIADRPKAISHVISIMQTHMTTNTHTSQMNPHTQMIDTYRLSSLVKQRDPMATKQSVDPTCPANRSVRRPHTVMTQRQRTDATNLVTPMKVTQICGVSTVPPSASRIASKILRPYISTAKQPLDTPHRTTPTAIHVARLCYSSFQRACFIPT